MIIVQIVHLIIVQIVDVDEKNQILTTNCWLTQVWNDTHLTWNYSGTAAICHIWTQFALEYIPIRHSSCFPEFFLSNISLVRQGFETLSLAQILEEWGISVFPLWRFGGPMWYFTTSKFLYLSCHNMLVSGDLVAKNVNWNCQIWSWLLAFSYCQWKLLNLTYKKLLGSFEWCVGSWLNYKILVNMSCKIL